MEAKPSEYREIIYDMLRRGESLKRIGELTGLSASAVYYYKAELNELERQRLRDRIDMPLAFWTEWIRAVNRIRRYYGKIEFPASREPDKYEKNKRVENWKDSRTNGGNNAAGN